MQAKEDRLKTIFMSEDKLLTSLLVILVLLLPLIGFGIWENHQHIKAHERMESMIQFLIPLLTATQEKVDEMMRREKQREGGRGAG